MFKDLIRDILNDINQIDNSIKKQQNLVRKCPLCNVEFKVLNIKFPDGSILKIDQCPNCSSLWFDKGELTKALEISLKDIEKFFPSTLGKSIKGSGKRICPVCSSNMKLINYSMDSNIWVDVCSCGIFLDAGELELIKLYSINPKTFKVEYIEENPEISSNISSTTSAITPLANPNISSSSINQPTETELTKNINEITNEINLLKKDIEDLKTSILSKIKTFENEIKNKNIKYLLSIYKDPFKEEKTQLRQIKNRLDIIKEKIQKFNLSIKDIKEFENINDLVLSLDKFILTRENSINVRIEEIQKEQEEIKKQEEIQKQELIFNKVENTVENKIENTTLIQNQNNQEAKEQKTNQEQINKIQSNLDTNLKDNLNIQSSISQKLDSEKKLENTTIKLNLKINKVKFNFYSNLISYFIYNSYILVLGENKLFLFNLNDINQNDLSLKEIKINYLSSRFKGFSFIDNKLFIFGNSGQIVYISNLDNLINSLELNEKNSVIFKIGYSDINNIFKFDNEKYLVIVNSKIYLIDKDFKILQEKTINVINGVNYKGNLIFSNSSGEILYLNSNFDIDKKISTQSFYTVKNFKEVNNKLFALSTGFIGYIQDSNFQKINLPKSFIEVNDINYLNGYYFIVGSSGNLFYTNNLINIVDFNSGIYENINSILKISDNLILALCNSAVLLKIEII
jgi:Zn-finger nucleic acid-binding protein